MDTEEIDEPIDDFLLDSVEYVGSREWIVQRLSTLKHLYYDKDPEVKYLKISSSQTFPITDVKVSSLC